MYQTDPHIFYNQSHVRVEYRIAIKMPKMELKKAELFTSIPARFARVHEILGNPTSRFDHDRPLTTYFYMLPDCNLYHPIPPQTPELLKITS